MGSPSRRPTVDAGRGRVFLNPPGQALGPVNAILSTTSVPYLVRTFPGPLSIKWMASGWGTWETSSGRYRVDSGSYLVLNRGQVYSLAIDTLEPRESFCAFFAAGVVEDAHRALTALASALLDDPLDAPQPDATFPEHVRPGGDQVIPRLRHMREGIRRGLSSSSWLEDQFHLLAEDVLLARRDARREMDGLPAVRASTREELYRRLCRGRDFLHASFGEPLTLAAVAREAGLAPHHFHRLFRSVFACTPHHYLVRLRLARAQALLTATDLSVTAVCLEVGFESPGTFSALFHRRLGLAPAAFRRRARANSGLLTWA